MKRLFLALIWLYQHTLSPNHSFLARFSPYGYCRFYPSCSVYAHDAIARFGAWRGGGLALLRLSRCHPWSLGGIDEVPLG